MGINLKNAGAYIHGQAPGKLDGLFHAVEAKCKALGLEPGRRDNLAGGDGTAVNGNVRGILVFVESVPEITDEDKTPITVDAGDEPASGDSLPVQAEKEARRAAVPGREKARVASLAAKEAAQGDLKKLYGTLLARFAAAGYKPKPQTSALT